MKSIKRFTNALIYQLTGENQFSLVEWANDQLAGNMHGPIAPGQLSTSGFIPPFGQEDVFAEPVGKYTLFVSVCKTERMLPGKVVRRETDDRIAKIEGEQDRRVYAKERNGIKEEVIQDLLPRAFLNHTRIDVLICYPYIFVDTASNTRAEEVLNLLRQALGSLPVLRLTPERSVADAMTGWMLSGDTPWPFSLGESFQSRGPSGEPSTLSGKGVDLSAEELHDALGTGLQQIHQMQLIYADDEAKITFTLTTAMGLKGIRWPKEFVDQIEADVGEDGDPVTEARATLLLLAITLKLLVRSLLLALGEPDEEDLV